MKVTSKATIFLFVAMALALFQFQGTEALAQSTFFTSQGCSGCHAAPVVATCNGCHHHGPASLKGVTNKTSYAPGETVSVNITGGNKSGWFRAVLYDQNSVELARSTGNASGMGSSATYPAVLTAPAPTTAGTYAWKVAWYGNQYDTSSLGTTWTPDATNPNHGEVRVSINSFTVAAAPAADTTAPVVTSFTLPSTSVTLTVPVSSLAATDAVGVTGYLITTSSTAPAASAAGWTAAAPGSVTASAAGSTTFYAWAKDAAGNVSAAQSSTVTITLPPATDTTAPVVSAFALPTSATGLSVPVSSFVASDNVGVTGYLITTSAVAPAAGSGGWSAAAPATVTAPGAGSVTFYAWAKDAAGNVSSSASATVSITVDTTSFALAVSTLADGTYTNNATLNISGTVSNSTVLKSLTVNGHKVVVASDGSFTYALKLNRGRTTVTVIAVDTANNKKTDKRTIIYDPAAPHIKVSTPADNSRTAQSFITVTGTINETSTVNVTVNSGNPQSAAIIGNKFSATVNLDSGINTIDASATDQAGNVSHAKRTIIYDNAAPSLAVTSPDQDITTSQKSLVLSGTVSDALSKVKVSITVNGRKHSVAVKNGAFQQKVAFSAAKLYAVSVTATDEAGNSSTVQRNIIYDPTSTGGSSTSHPFGWANPRSSHPDYVENNGVSSCISCHSIDPASKGQAMSCYNCHDKKW